MGENVLAADLVVEDVEAESGLRLRLAIELSLKGPDLFGRFEAHRQSPPPRHLRKRIRSQGPFLRRNYPASLVVRPCPTPERSAAKHGVEAATSDRPGLPRLPASPFQRAIPITPMDRTGASVDCFPVHSAFPAVPSGRHPCLHFRGLLRIHSRYGPLDRSTAQRRPLSRGSVPASRPARPLVSYQINRQLSGWNLPPLVIHAFGAHVEVRGRARWLGLATSAPFPFPAHQTGRARLRHPAFRLISLRAHGGGPSCARCRRCTPRSPNTFA